MSIPVNIFVSSTFSDMQSERDYLNRVIAPRLEEEFKDRDIQIQLIDLRWGIDLHRTNDTERENEVLKVCLNEIRNCKPFFIGLLGERYGWIPEADRMAELLLNEGITNSEETKSVTTLEMEYVLFHQKEPLLRSHFYLRKPEVYKAIPAHLKASYCDTYNPQLDKKEKSERIRKLENLKHRILQHYRSLDDMSRFKMYETTWEDERIGGLETWGEIVFNDLKEDLYQHITELSDTLPSTPFEKETKRLELFIRQRTSNFCGRIDFLSKVEHMLVLPGNTNSGMCLYGESGSGKSSISAKISELLHEKEEYLVLPAFCGQTGGSTSLSHVLQIFNMQLEQALKIPLSEYLASGSNEKIQARFSYLIKEASKHHKVVVLLDAVNMLENSIGVRHFSWLPENWQEQLFLFYTTTNDKIKPEIGGSGVSFLKMEVFATDDAREMVYMLAKKMRKTFPEAVVEKILEHKSKESFSCSSPLWTNMCVSILLSLDQDDFNRIYKQEKSEGTRAIESYMIQLVDEFPSDAGDLFVFMLDKASLYFGSERFVDQIISLLAYSRTGLPESLLERILGEEWDRLTFCNLRRWFKSFLIDHGNDRHWNFSHQLPRNAVQEKYTDRSEHVHSFIAKELLSSNLSHPLVKNELLYHLYHADLSYETARFLSRDFKEDDRVYYTGKLSELLIENREHADWFFALASRVEYSSQKQLSSFLLNFQSYVVENLRDRNEFELQRKVIEFTRKWHEKKFNEYQEEPWWGYILAANYELSGDYYLKLDDLNTAQMWYIKRLQLGEELYKNTSSDEFKVALSVAYDKLAEVKTRKGEYEEAKVLLEKKVQLSGVVLATGNSEEEGLDKLAAGKMGQANILNREGKSDEAVALMMEAYMLRKKLAKKAPTNLIYKYNLSLSAERISASYLTNGRINEAMNYSNAAIKIMEFVVKKDASSLLFRSGLAEIYEQHASIHDALGDWGESKKYFEESIHLSKNICDSGIASNENTLVYASTCNSYARLLHKHELSEDSYIYANQAIELYESANIQTSESISSLQSYTAALLSLSELHKERGELNEMYRLNAKYKSIIERLYKKLPNDEGIGMNYAGIFFIEAEEFELKEEYDKATQAYQKSEEIFASQAQRNPSNLNLINGLCIVCYRLGLLYNNTDIKEQAMEAFNKTLQFSTYLCENSTELSFKQRHQDFLHDIRNKGYIQ